MRLVIIGNESAVEFHRIPAPFDNYLPITIIRAFTAIQHNNSTDILKINKIIFFDYDNFINF